MNCFTTCLAIIAKPRRAQAAVLPRYCLLVFICQFPLVAISSGANYQVLHNFAGGSEGKTPYSGVVVIGNTVYGTTLEGGNPQFVNGFGTLYSVKTDGSSFATVHAFSSASTDGANPWGGLATDGQILYGTTELGGAGNHGTVFSLNPSGDSFSLLHSFNNTDGAAPVANVVVHGTALLGTTGSGGTSGNGTLFSINSNGTGFASLHSFDGAAGGQYPYSSLTVSGSTMYGTTLQGGGGNSIGTIFSSNLDGTNFHTLYSFSHAFPQGYDPYDYGGLTLVGSTLFGLAYFGGNQSQDGVLFSINTDGSNYHIVHTFAGGMDGAGAQAGLTQVGNVLFGTTTYGGLSNDGTLFELNSDGTGYKTIYSFSGSDGANPFGPLTFDNGVLYGTTSAGGTSADGVVFGYSVPEPATFVPLLVGLGCLSLARRGGIRRPVIVRRYES
jgi:uncharacterized repeat protein (TIGR03803 family)